MQIIPIAISQVSVKSRFEAAKEREFICRVCKCHISGREARVPRLEELYRYLRDSEITWDKPLSLAELAEETRCYQHSPNSENMKFFPLLATCILVDRRSKRVVTAIEREQAAKNFRRAPRFSMLRPLGHIDQVLATATTEVKPNPKHRVRTRPAEAPEMRQGPKRYGDERRPSEAIPSAKKNKKGKQKETHKKKRG